VADPLLRVENLVRRFGGVIATDHVSLDVAQGELHAIIGPNGAGKTTLISQLTGHLTPDSGSIYLGGRDISHLAAYRRSALGLARSFQITSLLLDFTVAATPSRSGVMRARKAVCARRRRRPWSGWVWLTAPARWCPD